MDHHLVEKPQYDHEMFRRRFRMSVTLFTPKLRQHLAYAHAVAADSFADYLQMAALTALSCLYEFCKVIINNYSTIYLRKPNPQKKNSILSCFAYPTNVFPPIRRLFYWRSTLLQGNGQVYHCGFTVASVQVMRKRPRTLCCLRDTYENSTPNTHTHTHMGNLWIQ
ncbi:hypothetical protein DFS34DRAFT_94674 [Phlyctochytrium arcticum]|nr:hypothetical protein DFS34DRAFT_94674 [Phlyctochytrium arcticum]